ncbi:PREDICTED: flocculation protein FLO11-like [Acropora digitifera]|uniref:flocculation protein FLO11-like n=1 Tax=Acropora digitifera TaxID=70779 RepID=UPI00077A0DB5|nr:PREDICTED: flocculation protein FLO11-like [Acropora digitifera]
MDKNVALIFVAITMFAFWNLHGIAAPLADPNTGSEQNSSRDVTSSLQNSTADNITSSCNGTSFICSEINGNFSATLQSNTTSFQLDLNTFCAENQTNTAFLCNGTVMNLTEHCDSARASNLSLVCLNGSSVNTESDVGVSNATQSSTSSNVTNNLTIASEINATSTVNSSRVTPESNTSLTTSPVNVTSAANETGLNSSGSVNGTSGTTTSPSVYNASETNGSSETPVTTSGTGEMTESTATKEPTTPETTMKSTTTEKSTSSEVTTMESTTTGKSTTPEVTSKESTTTEKSTTPEVTTTRESTTTEKSTTLLPITAESTTASATKESSSRSPSTTKETTKSTTKETVKTIEKTTTHTQEKLTKLTTMSGQGESTTQFSSRFSFVFSVFRIVSSNIHETERHIYLIVPFWYASAAYQVHIVRVGGRLWILYSPSEHFNYFKSAAAFFLFIQSIQFFYTNVLIPIGAGALVALFIAFLVVLCRCCRRRKLKKVRYFGKAHGEMSMDKLNLLADSSDEE